MILLKRLSGDWGNQDKWSCDQYRGGSESLLDIIRKLENLTGSRLLVGEMDCL